MKTIIDVKGMLMNSENPKCINYHEQMFSYLKFVSEETVNADCFISFNRFLPPTTILVVLYLGLAYMRYPILAMDLVTWTLEGFLPFLHLPRYPRILQDTLPTWPPIVFLRPSLGPGISKLSTTILTGNVSEIQGLAYE